MSLRAWRVEDTYERAAAINELQPEVDPETLEADDETTNEGNSVCTQADLSMKELDEDKAKLMHLRMLATCKLT